LVTTRSFPFIINLDGDWFYGWGFSILNLWIKMKEAAISTHTLAHSNLVHLYVYSSQDNGLPTMLAAKLRPCLDHNGNGNPWRGMQIGSVEILFLSN
jgi:hypothetical protein